MATNMNIMIPTSRPDQRTPILVAMLSDAAIKDKLAQSGYLAEGSSPEELGKLLKAEIAQWSAVIKAVGIKLD